jgi:hypothetical protein
MDKEKIRYIKHDNCFLSIDDFTKAQELMKKQFELNWPTVLEDLIKKTNPLYRDYLNQLNLKYYWTVYQSEWATDILFKSKEDLSKIYNQMILEAITLYSCDDVMKFLGKKIHPNLKSEIISDYKKRTEGVRIKHSANGNSIKAYDKAGIILRIETTMNNPSQYKIFRPKEGDTQEKSKLDR